MMNVLTDVQKRHLENVTSKLKNAFNANEDQMTQIANTQWTIAKQLKQHPANRKCIQESLEVL